MTNSSIPAHKLYRLQRTADKIRYVLANILKKANDPRLHQVTITHVQLSADFSHAKVFFTLLDQAQLNNIESALKKGTGFFRYELAHSAAFRSVPKLHFIKEIMQPEKPHDST